MNKAIVMGRLTRDPELKQTQSGVSVCSFTLAVDRRYKNANGEREADFLPIVAWRQQAEFVHRYFRKGQRMLVSGTIQVRSWEANDGSRRYTTEIIADEIEFADSKRDSDNSSYGGASGTNQSSGGYGSSYNRPAQSRRDDHSFFNAARQTETAEDEDGGFFNFADDDSGTPPFEV